MNLTNLNVVELDAQEVMVIDGGFFGPFRAGLTLAYRNWLLQSSDGSGIPDWTRA